MNCRLVFLCEVVPLNISDSRFGEITSSSDLMFTKLGMSFYQVTTALTEIKIKSFS